MVEINLKKIKKEAQEEIKKAQTLSDLNVVFRHYFGRKAGMVNKVLRSLKNLPKDKKISIGKEANELKLFLTEEIEKKKKELGDSSQDAGAGEWFDVSVPGKRPSTGHLHPLTTVRRQIMMIFQDMGFSVIEGPELENEWYNFDALNIPKDHPARDAWDTFWIKNKKEEEKKLLRTHTSPVQARYMEEHKPPLRVIAPGKVFRHEATDASHEAQFYQIEGLMVDQDVSVPHFKAVIKHFLSTFFEKDVKIRLRPDFFPFTEPSFEIAMSCLNCQGKGCPVCKKTGWLEIAGAGMVHPNVFSACKLDPREWQGWAFGFGWDRLTMMKYKINDIRLFNSGDLRFLSQF